MTCDPLRMTRLELEVEVARLQGVVEVMYEREHQSHCGPHRGGFKICYCRCPKCHSPEGSCICHGCDGWHGKGNRKE
jgi:hypothetical protein